MEEGAQLTLAIRLLQEEGLVPLQEDIHPRQEEGPIPPTLATHHPPTLLKVGSPPHLLATTTPLLPVLDILLPLLLIPMQLQEITKSMMTTVTQQTQVTVPPQLTSTGHLVLEGQPAMGMRLQKSTPVTSTTPLGVIPMVALSTRAGEVRV